MCRGGLKSVWRQEQEQNPTTLGTTFSPHFAKQEREGPSRRNFLLSLHSHFGGKLRSRRSTTMDGTEIVSRFDAVGISGMKTATKLLEKGAERNRLRVRPDRLCESRTEFRGKYP